MCGHGSSSTRDLHLEHDPNCLAAKQSYHQSIWLIWYVAPSVSGDRTRLPFMSTAWLQCVLNCSPKLCESCVLTTQPLTITADKQQLITVPQCCMYVCIAVIEIF